ncbi:hypothetical protein LTR08_007246 [Meristemomyces frigidus]|nr:hypothetical protein LTR08_007246 [Meristemomyces frigidus]
MAPLGEGVKLAAGINRYIIIYILLAVGFGRRCGPVRSKRAAFAAKMVACAVAIALGLAAFAFGVAGLVCEVDGMGLAWGALDLVVGFVSVALGGLRLGLEPGRWRGEEAEEGRRGEVVALLGRVAADLEAEREGRAAALAAWAEVEAAIAAERAAAVVELAVARAEVVATGLSAAGPSAVGRRGASE